MIPASEEVTYDTLLRGRVGLYQPARGFRSSLDPVLLAGFVAPPFGRFLDIGCGTGALSFLLLARDPAASGVGVEIQPRLAALAERGRARNGFEARLELRQGDVRAQSGLGLFNLIATNPPYRPLGKGVVSGGQRARHRQPRGGPDPGRLAGRGRRRAGAAGAAGRDFSRRSPGRAARRAGRAKAAGARGCAWWPRARERLLGGCWWRRGGVAR